MAHSILIAVWHLLANDCDHHELGGDYFARRQDPDLLQKRLVQRLEQLGNKVTVEPLATAT